MPTGSRRTLFLLFLASGFCGLVYQIVWLRLAFSAFGVITPIVSVLVSLFMLGLALGSWLGGRWIGPMTRRSGVSAIVFYAGAEAVIASSALALPALFSLSQDLLLPVGAMDSGAYLVACALLMGVSLLPWCFCMGVTYPFAMEYVKELDADQETSFSFLYLANVVGAMLGAISTSVILVEILGLSRTLLFAGAVNLSTAAGALVLWRVYRPVARVESQADPIIAQPMLDPWRRGREILPKLLLFATGFISMALEIVWMRAFTPLLGTLVYAFSGLLAVYLLSTWVGSALYRRLRETPHSLSVPGLVALLSLAALLPNVAADPRVVAHLGSSLGGGAIVSTGVVVALASIAPFCLLLGYLTPMLIDHVARGRAPEAGSAYALNVLGSILGPLAAGYLLLPALGSRLSMLVLAAPLLLLFPFAALRSRRLVVAPRLASAVAAALVIFAVTGIGGLSYEEGSHLEGIEVRRDHTATVISFGEGLQRHLVVNGRGMTTLSGLTKVMAHLPMASLDHQPKSALVIAFGMGTTYRSLLAWDVDVTAVELVPSVVDAFEYYFYDAERARNNPRGRIVVDDGRRYLKRTDELFDVITIDPPPPVEAAGSSLLYSEEFYAVAKRRLQPGGIVQQWFPDGALVEAATRQAVLRAALNSFAHVRVFYSMSGAGLHILLSDRPIQVPGAQEFAARLPRAAQRDLVEWAPFGTDPAEFIASRILDREASIDRLVTPDFRTTVTDDRPFNEYFLLRRALAPADPRATADLPDQLASSPTVEN